MASLFNRDIGLDFFTVFNFTLEGFGKQEKN